MEITKKVSTVLMDQSGRIHTLDGVCFNIHEIYSISIGYLNNALEGELKDELEDEGAFDAGLKLFEETWLTERGVTHIVDFEDFGDHQEHTLQEFLAI